MIICLEHMAQMMLLPLTVSCFSKIQIGFTFLVLAHPCSPGKGPLNGYVRVCDRDGVVTSGSNCKQINYLWMKCNGRYKVNVLKTAQAFSPRYVPQTDSLVHRRRQYEVILATQKHNCNWI